VVKAACACLQTACVLILLCYKYLRDQDLDSTLSWSGAMADSGSARAQSPEEVYRLVYAAVVRQRPIAVVYDGTQRLLCPHVLGINQAGKRRMFCYQYGGDQQERTAARGWSWKLALPGAGKGQ